MSKSLNTAFVEGFVKKAASFGLNREQIHDLMKKAQMLPELPYSGNTGAAASPQQTHQLSPQPSVAQLQPAAPQIPSMPIITNPFEGKVNLNLGPNTQGNFLT